MHNISLRPITEQDMEFLFHVYASTREEEMRRTGWPAEQVQSFLNMQFNLQHNQYMQNYDNAHFDIILLANDPIGRLYADRREEEIRIIDIALLPTCRGKGIGSKIMLNLIAEANEKQILLSLHVERNNPAMQLYEKLGFVKKDDTGVYFLMERTPTTITRDAKEAVHE